ncbi:MAG: hypothetical protein ABIO29_05660 [Sphingomicrobium sp.]
MGNRGRCLALLASAAAMLAGCARSEPAEMPANEAAIAASGPVLNETMPDVVPSATTDLPVAAALRAALADTGGIAEGAKWLIARTDLNGDGKDEALAYVVDSLTCGTGGCSLYVLSDNATNGFQVIDTISPAQLPVYVLSLGGRDGWATLGVTVGGGGAERALMAVPHDAKGYASNPTVAPAKKAEAGNAKPLIADDFAKAMPVPKG